MTWLLSFWTSVIPTLPLVLPHDRLMYFASVGLLALCAAALWCERERPISRPEPAHFGDDEQRLAA